MEKVEINGKRIKNNYENIVDKEQDYEKVLNLEQEV